MLPGAGQGSGGGALGHLAHAGPHGLGLHAEAVGDDVSALAHLADAVTRSRPQRGGHLWSHVWALTAGVRIARRTGDTHAEGWYDEALVIAQRCGMRALTDQLVHLT